MKNNILKNKCKIDRNKILHNAIERRMMNKLEEIDQYYSELESDFSREQKKLREQYEKEIEYERLDSDFITQIEEFFSEEHYKIEKIHLRIFRYSIIVTLYSLLEIFLNDLCHYLGNSKKLSLPLTDIKGNGIERSKIYLEKVCLVNFQESNHEWNEILKLNKIRNCIVHAYGDIRMVNSSKKTKNIIKNTKGLQVENDMFLEIDKDFIPDTLSSIKKFLKSVCDESFKIV